MQVYLVGGAVRDQLLGLPVTDKDFVVVGTTAEVMIEAGFLPVGADFPVFLHPDSNQEFALARTERKSGHGYQGFSIHASPEVTLEEDLQRRDLTINAMAIEVTSLYDDTPLTGTIIDPYGGLDDIKNKQLRHISSAFSEDPLRVLRVARFYSRYYQKGFTIADETQKLMRQLVRSGELKHLSAERIWQESSRAMLQYSPQIYWQQLFEIGALDYYFAPLASAWLNEQIRQTAQAALQFAGQLQLSLSQRWGLLMASLHAPLYLGVTARTLVSDEADTTIKPDQDTIKNLTQISQIAKVPKQPTQFARLFIEQADQLSIIEQLSPAGKIALIQACSAHKRPETLTQLLIISQVCQLARQYYQMTLALDSFHAIAISDINPNLKGAAIGNALTQARIQHLARLSANA